ncbi:type IX secretion system sortase PorU [Flexithrix dorotheae]|uniref:type IX secretion system sortase PorU n=1 Tax=Flexithrix dorotheae TaxID=70993 RepID=UPI0003790387|nr:type IX secretion system sortase PorU [Flexithrix dorotheae]
MAKFCWKNTYFSKKGKIYVLYIHSLIILLIFPYITSYGQSILKEGEIIKVGIVKNGIYKIDNDFLKKHGISGALVNPRNIQVFGDFSGMLNQSNQAANLSGLKECSIFLSDPNANKFSNNYLLFYGESPHTVSYQSDEQKFIKEQNIYADTNYYFIKISNNQNSLIDNRKSLITSSSNIINTYNAYIFHEVEEYNILNSGRRWFGEKFGSKPSFEFKFPITNISKASQIQLSISLMAKSSSNSEFNLLLNDTNVGKTEIPAINKSLGGALVQDNFTIESAALPNLDGLKLVIKFVKNSLEAIGYLDFFNINFEKKLIYEGETFSFRSIKSTENPYSTFKIKTSNDLTFWDITNPLKPINQLFKEGADGLEFTTDSYNLKEFVAFEQHKISHPLFISKISNQDILNLSVPDLLIISNSIFYQEAKKLAQFRESNDGLSALVVTTEQIFNEFSSGRPDISAIRNFVRYLYLKDSKKLKYLLLFGDGSYDYKNTIETYSSIKNTNLVPTYQSRESLHPIYSYTSDDYYGFLDESEGLWSETNHENYTLELGIGRLPVATKKEAQDIVDKLIHYSTSEKTFGNWRHSITFIADDGDLNLHQKQADRLAEFVHGSYPKIVSTKLFTDAFPQLETAYGEVTPELNEHITRQIHKGSLIVNYTGHGSNQNWASEQILGLKDVISWDNYNNLPLIFTATCEYGKYDQPTQKSGAEYALLNPNGGAIALMTNTRSVFSNNNFELNQDFFQILFNKPNGQNLRLGDVIKEIKNANSGIISNRNFTLLGDPSMQLSFPKNEIKITRINEKQVDREPDTLYTKREIKISGEIYQENSFQNNFNGELEVTLYGDPLEITTLANEKENTKMSFTDRNNVLFNGKASIKNGKFEILFMISDNNQISLKKGKIQCYAYSIEENTDAQGVYDNFLTSDTLSPTPTDKTQPAIDLFIHNRFFEDGGKVPPNTSLLMDVHDESGIRLGKKNQSGIIAILDPDSLNIKYNLDDYYVTEKDNFKNGYINFPLLNLSQGYHNIKIIVSDNFGNETSKTVLFEVVKPKKNIAPNVTVFPNPFSNSTTFKLDHGFIGDNINYEILFYNSLGYQIHRQTGSMTYSRSPIFIPLELKENFSTSQLLFYKVQICAQDNQLNCSSASGKILRVE